MAATLATVEIVCRQCGAGFTARRERNWHNRKFCGPACALKAKQSHRPEYLRAFAKRPLVCAESGVKVCRDCERERPVTKFHKSTNYKDGRTSRCASCVAKYGRELRNREDDETRKARTKHRSQVGQAWKLKNKDKVRAYTARTTAQNTQRFQRWRKANRDRSNAIIAASTHRRRSQKEGGLSGPETSTWFLAQKRICHWCGKRCAKDAQIDHIQPLSRGGGHEAHNLCISCPTCNQRKSARDPVEWARMIGKLL
jgi:hypothetical protein